ncbi:MAG TPA: YciI family protein [Gaiellaceae bacterium]|nr:YciI family protein [Gaiellaceae bacterium]
MKFIALIYGDETSWETRSPEERSKLIARYRSVTEEMRAAGVYADANQLTPTRDATSVRVRDAETLVVDGPYAEVKEALGGYYLLECDSLDDALDWAARIPAAEDGAVEVRPVYLDTAEEQL